MYNVHVRGMSVPGGGVKILLQPWPEWTEQLSGPGMFCGHMLTQRYIPLPDKQIYNSHNCVYNCSVPRWLSVLLKEAMD